MKINSLAIDLLQLLIENHEDGDSLIRESNLIKYVKNKSDSSPTTDEISESVYLINSSVNKKVIQEGLIQVGGILSSSHESSYFTEFSISELLKIQKLVIQNDTNRDNKDSVISLDDIVDFLESWNYVPFEEKQRITRETDRLNNIGVTYYNQDNFDEAINYFSKAIKVMPTNDDALKNLKICYKYTREFEKMTEISFLLSKLGFDN